MADSEHMFPSSSSWSILAREKEVGIWIYEKRLLSSTTIYSVSMYGMHNCLCQVYLILHHKLPNQLIWRRRRDENDRLGHCRKSLGNNLDSLKLYVPPWNHKGNDARISHGWRTCMLRWTWCSLIRRIESSEESSVEFKEPNVEGEFGLDDSTPWKKKNVDVNAHTWIDYLR